MAAAKDDKTTSVFETLLDWVVNDDHDETVQNKTGVQERDSDDKHRD